MKNFTLAAAAIFKKSVKKLQYFCNELTDFDIIPVYPLAWKTPGILCKTWNV